jgi:hypothetical protein
MEKEKAAVTRFFIIALFIFGAIFSIHFLSSAKAQNAQSQAVATKTAIVAGNTVNPSNVWSEQQNSGSGETVISQQAAEVFAQLKGGKVASECSIILSKQSYLLIYSLLLLCFAIDCFVSTFIFTWQTTATGQTSNYKFLGTISFISVLYAIILTFMFGNEAKSACQFGLPTHNLLISIVLQIGMPLAAVMLGSTLLIAVLSLMKLGLSVSKDTKLELSATQIGTILFGPIACIIASVASLSKMVQGILF